MLSSGASWPRPVSLAGAMTTVLVLAGCAQDGSPTAASAAGTQAPSPVAPREQHEDSHAAGSRLPSSHVHGVAVNPADQRVYLATHGGLVRYDAGGAVRVGPPIDLMGFAVAGPDHFYASGHPGPGVDLPEPVGLIESTDGGATWLPVSRQGQSDFHALAATETAVFGYDGAALRVTEDGTTWRDLAPPVEPHALAASPDGAVVLATSPSGPVRSTDAGASWIPLDSAPLLQLVDWADGATVVGVTPTGTVAVSTDAGATWTEQGSIGGSPQALGASSRADGSLRVLAVTADAVLDSPDGGRSFQPVE